MARRDPGEINAGSMADIAFLLLIFFLVTTTMDRDTGILRLLPPPVEDIVDPPVVKDRNVFEVLANADNQLLVEGELAEISELKDMAKMFMTNPENDPDLPELKMLEASTVKQNLDQAKANLQREPDNSDFKKTVKKWENKQIAIEEYGGSFKVLPNSAIISLQNDRKTSYNLYIQVQNELAAAVNELRNAEAMKMYNVNYDDLNDQVEADQRKMIAIRTKFPQRVSEAEPRE